MTVMTGTVRPLGVTRRLRTGPYWPVLSHPVVRRLLPGYGLSALGDGMSAVAIAWLALRLAPPGPWPSSPPAGLTASRARAGLSYSTSCPGCGSSGSGVGSAGIEPSRPAW